ncbi:hypothetical protein L208DRAFT_1001392, partial [Tricholoma matsutake]
WRCSDCISHLILCHSCCRCLHASTPFRRVQCWVGEYFQDSWLLHTGLILHFSHKGKPCP